jgi:hypothetical protein
MAATLLDQINELADELATIQKKHHLTENTVVKIAEMIFNNYWTAKQMELQARSAGYGVEDAPDIGFSDEADEVYAPLEVINGVEHQVDDKDGEE